MTLSPSSPPPQPRLAAAASVQSLAGPRAGLVTGHQHTSPAQPSLATPASTCGEVLARARVRAGLLVMVRTRGGGRGTEMVLVMVTGYIDCWRQATACSLANLCPAVHTGLRLGTGQAGLRSMVGN